MSIDLAVASFAISVNCNANKRELLKQKYLETNDFNCKSSKKNWLEAVCKKCHRVRCKSNR